MFQSPQYVYHEGEGSVAIAKGTFDGDLNINNLTVTWDAMSIRNKLAKYYKVQIYADNLIVEEYLEEVNNEDLEIEKNYNFYEFFQNNDWENMVFSAVIYPLLDNKLPTKVYFASDVTKFVCNLHIELTKEESEEEGDPNNVECETTNGTLPLTYNWDVNGEKTSVGPANDTTNLLEDITLSEEEDTVVTCTVIDGMGCIEERKIIFELPEELNPDEGFYKQGVGFRLKQWEFLGSVGNSYLNIFIPEADTEVNIYYGQDLSKKEVYKSVEANSIKTFKDLIPKETFFEIDATKPVIAFVNNIEYGTSGGYEIPPASNNGNEYYVIRFDGKTPNIRGQNTATGCVVCTVPTKDDPNPVADIYIDDVLTETISYPNEFYKFIPNSGNAQKISSNKPISVFYAENLTTGSASDVTNKTVMDVDRCGFHYIIPSFFNSPSITAIIISLDGEASIDLNTKNTTENITINNTKEYYTKTFAKGEDYLEIISDKKIQVFFINDGSSPDPDITQAHPVDAGIKRTGFVNHISRLVRHYHMRIITHKNADKDSFSITPHEEIIWNDTNGDYMIGSLQLSEGNKGYYLSSNESYIAYILGASGSDESILYSLGRNWLKEY